MSRTPQHLIDSERTKGTAFTREEREEYGLIGRLPAAVETLDQQAARAYTQFSHFQNDLNKYVFMDQLHGRNETVYYKLLVDHLKEMLPIVYDPTVGEAIKNWSKDYRRSRAVIYLDVNHPEDVRPALEGLGMGPEDVDLLVASDAEAILGIGDWGVNGTDISVGKLAIYTAAAGIDPRRVVAVNLDAGTDNEQLLNDPSYLGNRHARVRGERYDTLIKTYVETASELFPKALLHFEDFGPSNARRILEQYRKDYRVFNDDMQGTGAIVMSAVIAALRAKKETFENQRLLVYGAGTAGTGMADQICAAMVRAGLSQDEARKRIWLIDVNGLVLSDDSDLRDYQRPYARDSSEVSSWTTNEGRVGLLETVRQVHPTILIGTSTDHGAFTQEVIEALCEGTQRPVVLPLSNPTERIEVMPQKVIEWSKGQAFVAAGIPAEDYDYEGTTFVFGQGNNALLYPGLGLGTIVSGAAHITDGMLEAAAEAVASQTDASRLGSPILPPVENLRASSATVAVAVARAAHEDGAAPELPENLIQAVQDAMWEPVYRS